MKYGQTFQVLIQWRVFWTLELWIWLSSMSTNGWSQKVIDQVEKDWKIIKMFWGNTFLFFWRELVCKEKESLNILFILFLLCWNCKKKNAYSDFLGRRFWKKQEDINTCKLKNWTKSLSLVGFLGKKISISNPK